MEKETRVPETRVRIDQHFMSGRLEYSFLIANFHR